MDPMDPIDCDPASPWSTPCWPSALLRLAAPTHVRGEAWGMKSEKGQEKKADVFGNHHV